MLRRLLIGFAGSVLAFVNGLILGSVINAYALYSGGVSGSGTVNTIAKWTSATGLGNGMATDNGATFSLGGANGATVYTLDVRRTADTSAFRAVSAVTPAATSGAGITGRTAADPTATGQRLGFYLFGSDTADANTAGIVGWSTETWSGGARGSRIGVETVANASTTRTERASFEPGGGVGIGGTRLTLNDGEIGQNKMTASASAPGAAGAKHAVLCGTNAGTAKLVLYAGTSSTPVTIVDNVGTGVTGC